MRHVTQFVVLCVGLAGFTLLLGADLSPPWPPPPRIPVNQVLAGTITSQGHWYPMDRVQVAFVTKLLSGKPLSPPEGKLVQIPFLTERLILWGSVDGKSLIPLDFVSFSANATFFLSEKNQQLYGASDVRGHESLDMIANRMAKGVGGKEDKGGQGR